MWEVSLSDKRKISAKPKVVQIEDNTKKNPFFSFIVEMPPTFDEVKVTIKRVKNQMYLSLFWVFQELSDKPKRPVRGLFARSLWVFCNKWRKTLLVIFLFIIFLRKSTKKLKKSHLNHCVTGIYTRLDLQQKLKNSSCIGPLSSSLGSRSFTFLTVTLFKNWRVRFWVAKVMEWHCQSYGMRLSKLWNDTVKAMEWGGQSYGMRRSKLCNDELKAMQWGG